MKLSRQLINEYIDILAQYRFIIVQHMLGDSVKFIKALVEGGIEIFSVIAKPSYSSRIECCDEIKKLNIPIGYLIGRELEDKELCNGVLDKANNKSLEDCKPIAILDLAGEYADIAYENNYQYLKVIVEDTAYGHRKYENREYKCHVYSVAKSIFKEVEARFVGSSVVNSAELLFRNMGKTLFGKKVMLIGYGMIGRNAAFELKKNGCKSIICENNKERILNAYFDGFEIGESALYAKEYSIIIGATGTTSINFDNIDIYADNTYLISGSSKQVEINIKQLEDISDSKYEVCEGVICYNVKKKSFYLFNNGQPVNFFHNSIPDEIIDFLFAEMLYGIVQSTKDTLSHSICFVEKDGIEKISQLYLDEKLLNN